MLNGDGDDGDSDCEFIIIITVIIIYGDILALSRAEHRTKLHNMTTTTGKMGDSLPSHTTLICWRTCAPCLGVGS